MIRIGPVSIAAFGALAVSVCLAWLLPSTARGECLYFEVNSWKLYQSNGAQVFFDVQQTDGNFQGAAIFDIPGVERDHHGSVTGLIAGKAVNFTIRWDDGAVGEYTGAVTGLTDSNDRLGIPLGISLEGSTVDKTNGASRATWHAHLNYRCLQDDGIYPKVGSLNFGPPPSVALGRTGTPAPAGPPMSICKRAAQARARNSPVAAELEAQCGVTTTTPAGNDTHARTKVAGVVAPPGPLVRVAPRPGTPGAASASPSAEALAGLAAKGEAVASRDAGLAQARAQGSDASYRRGFDIATGLLGDPAKGALGATAMGPDSSRIREALDAAGQRGFDAAVAFNLSRKYRR